MIRAGACLPEFAKYGMDIRGVIHLTQFASAGIDVRGIVLGWKKRLGAARQLVQTPLGFDAMVERVPTQAGTPSFGRVVETVAVQR